ncbi:MAG TPA: type II asparaginase [Thermodesulfobacteriota bacterium]|nr:type II asparaginase [Thermodesulfobacteriota bacterium]
MLIFALAGVGILGGHTISTAQTTGKKLPKVKILATGGTIAGRAGSSTQMTGYASGAIGIDALIEAVPEIKKIAEVSGEQITNLSSTALTQEVWLKLARKTNELLSGDTDGVVITHGTASLEETAYFLNLVVKSAKPVVLVGAMRPATAISADGPVNLFNAVSLAGSREAAGRGVLIALNDEINGARDATKSNIMTVETFRAPELGFLGYILDGKPVFYRETLRRHTTKSEFDITNVTALPRVDIVYSHLDADRVPIDAVVAAGAKGIVYANLAAVNIPPKAKEGLVAAQKKGLVIVRAYRGGNGIIPRAVEDDQTQFVAGDNLNPQKARVLLMMALTKTSSPAEIQRIFYEY